LRQRILNLRPRKGGERHAHSLLPKPISSIYYTSSVCSKTVTWKVRTEAVTALRKTQLLTQGLFATYKLAEEIERQGGKGTAQPETSAAQFKAARGGRTVWQCWLNSSHITAKRGDAEDSASFSKAKGRSLRLAPPGSATAASGARCRRTLAGLTRVRLRSADYVLAQRARAGAAQYRMDLRRDPRPPPGDEAVPFTKFLRLPGRRPLGSRSG